MFSASYSYLKKAKHSNLAETYKEYIYLKFIITKSSEQSSRWDADSRSARQAISRHLCNLNFYYRLNKKKLYIYPCLGPYSESDESRLQHYRLFPAYKFYPSVPRHSPSGLQKIIYDFFFIFLRVGFSYYNCRVHDSNKPDRYFNFPMIY